MPESNKYLKKIEKEISDSELAFEYEPDFAGYPVVNPKGFKTDTPCENAIRALILMGKSYTSIQLLLGCSTNRCVLANRELIKKEYIVKAPVMRQIIRLVEWGTDISTISLITGETRVKIKRMQFILKERKLIENAFEEVFEFYGEDPKWDFVYSLLWREFSFGSLRIQQLKNKKYQLMYKDYSSTEYGLKVLQFDDLNKLGLKLRKIYGSGESAVSFDLNGSLKKINF